MRGLTFLFIIASFMLFLSAGCLLKPFSGSGNATAGSGCAFSNPPCGSGYACVNNTCALISGSGCDYDNPPCDAASDESCVNNTCVKPALPQGCAYSNPACGQDYDCVNNSCVEKTTCGKFGCQQGENKTCCQDCGCPAGYSCDASGACLASGAKLELAQTSVQPIPPVVLYAVPPMTIEKGAGPLAQLTIRNTGSETANGIKLKSDFQGYTGATIQDVASIPPGANATIGLTPPFSDKALAIKNGTIVKLQVNLQYKGGNQSHSDDFTIDVPLGGRDSFDWRIPEAAAAWMRPTDLGISNLAADATDHAEIKTDEERERAARQIFNHLQARSTQYSDRCDFDRLAFPAETLVARSGGCADLAVLFSDLLESVGMKSVVIKTPDAVLSGYIKMDDSIAPIDMRALGGQDFGTALSDGAAEYAKEPASNAVVYPEQLWGGGVRQADPGIEYAGPIITTSSANCKLLEDSFTVNYWFANNGYDMGRRCVNSTLYEGGTPYFSKRVCVDIALGDKKNITFVFTNITEAGLTAKCWID